LFSLVFVAFSAAALSALLHFHRTTTLPLRCSACAAFSTSVRFTYYLFSFRPHLPLFGGRVLHLFSFGAFFCVSPGFYHMLHGSAYHHTTTCV